MKKKCVVSLVHSSFLLLIANYRKNPAVIQSNSTMCIKWSERVLWPVCWLSANNLDVLLFNLVYNKSLFVFTLGKIVITTNVLSPLCIQEPFMVTWATGHSCRANIKGQVARIHMYSQKQSACLQALDATSPLWTAQWVFTGFTDCVRLLHVMRLVMQLSSASPFFKSNCYLIKQDHMQNNIQVLLMRVM